MAMLGGEIVTLGLYCSVHAALQASRQNVSSDRVDMTLAAVCPRSVALLSALLQ